MPGNQKIRVFIVVICFLSLASVYILLWVSTTTTTTTTTLLEEGKELGDVPTFRNDLIKRKTTQTKQSVTTNNNNNNSSLQSKPLRIVLVGDSLTRYMYLSLTYYLKHNKTWAPKGHEMLEKVKDPHSNNWNEWLAFTNVVLRPYEECDCYRYWEHPFKWFKHCENRYYHDDHQNYIAFLTKFGGNPFHGHVAADKVFQQQQQQQQHNNNNNNNNNHQTTLNQTLRSYDWVYPTWSDLIDQYISQWNPKPDYFVFNNGHWKAHELRDEQVLKDLKVSLDRAGIRGIYRTTTFRQDEPNFENYTNNKNHRHDKLVCRYFPCVNVSWTAGLTSDEDYVDPVHFRAPVNNRMTRQLLEFLAVNEEAEESKSS
jgi:hypothetical protein